MRMEGSVFPTYIGGLRVQVLKMKKMVCIKNNAVHKATLVSEAQRQAVPRLFSSARWPVLVGWRRQVKLLNIWLILQIQLLEYVVVLLYYYSTGIYCME
jgi:hypothetical protein